MRGILPALFGLASLAYLAPAAADISIEQAIAIAREHGMQVIREVELDDGKWEIEGRDAEGREIEIDIDARTGEVLEVELD